MRPPPWFPSLLCYSADADRFAQTFVLGAYLLLAGTIRFTIELVRMNKRFSGIFVVAHLASLAAMAIGIALLLKSDHHQRLA